MKISQRDNLKFCKFWRFTFSTLHQNKSMGLQSYHGSLLAGDSIFWRAFCKPGRIFFPSLNQLDIKSLHRGISMCWSSSKCIGSVSELLQWMKYYWWCLNIWVDGSHISQLIRQAEVMGPYKFPMESIQPVSWFNSKQNQFLFLRNTIVIWWRKHSFVLKSWGHFCWLYLLRSHSFKVSFN